VCAVLLNETTATDIYSGWCVGAVRGVYAPALARPQPVGMIPGDACGSAPPGFAVVATAPASPVAAIEVPDRALYGLQFHPEVVHTPHGRDILRRFVLDVAGSRPGAEKLLEAVATAVAGTGTRTDRLTHSLPEKLQRDVERTIGDWEGDGRVRRIWAGHATLWTGTDENEWLDWRGIRGGQRAQAAP